MGPAWLQSCTVNYCISSVVALGADMHVTRELERGA